MSDSFTVKFSYKGKSIPVDGISRDALAADLLSQVRHCFQVDDDTILRLLFKGKTIAQDTVDVDGAASDNFHPAFPEGTKIPKSGAKVIVMGSAATGIQKLNSLRSDPLMRGFDDEKSSGGASSSVLSKYWGPLHGNQDKQYKFCRFQECTDASFGSRPGETTPHAFEARALLELLATDPGVVAILKSRELVVGTLGEMDPIDDRLMQAKAREGACLLGYNTNMGMRIDVKLRTDDLVGFRPYPELASTLIHELSHNWVADHDVVFWTNFGQMRVEYLWTHARLMKGGYFVGGRKTAALAGVAESISSSAGGAVKGSKALSESQMMDNICQSVFAELARDMSMHRLPVQLVAPAVLAFSKELMAEAQDDAILDVGGHRLGGANTTGQSADASEVEVSTRERALAAAEKRAREARDKSSSG